MFLATEQVIRHNTGDSRCATEYPGRRVDLEESLALGIGVGGVQW